MASLAKIIGERQAWQAAIGELAAGERTNGEDGRKSKAASKKLKENHEK
jgi:hypothetical protein